MRFAILVTAVFVSACASIDSSGERTASLDARVSGVERAELVASADLQEVDGMAYGDNNTETCRREAVVGSRIIRQRCFEVTGAEKDLLRAQTEFEIEYAREQALIAEQERMEQQNSPQREGSLFQP